MLYKKGIKGKLILLGLVVLCICMVSCSDTPITPVVSDNDINYIKFSYSINDGNKYVPLTTFYTEDTSYGTQTVTAECYNKEGQLLEGKTVEWTHDLPKDTVHVSNATTFSFNPSSIGVQNNYTITASCKAESGTVVTSKYEFSYASVKGILENYLYSYINISNAELNYVRDSSGNLVLNTTGNPIVESIDTSKTPEYDKKGVKITSADERMIINQNDAGEYVVTYATNGTSGILLSPKDGAAFGTIKVTSSDSDVSVLDVGKGQFFLLSGYTGGTVDVAFRSATTTKKTVNITMEAGTLQKKSIKLTLDPESITLYKPYLSAGWGAPKGDGLIFTLSGDNISTEAKKVEDGNQLHYSVQRRPYGDASAPWADYVPTMFESTETKWVPGALQMHLAHCGEYKISAYIADAIGNKSETLTKEITIKPYEKVFASNEAFASCLTQLAVSESIASEGASGWDEYTSPAGTTMDTPRPNQYRLKIDNKSSDATYYVTVNFTSKDHLSENFLVEKLPVSSLTTFDEYYKYGGKYDVELYQGKSGEGYAPALPSDSEALRNYGTNKMTFTILGDDLYAGKTPLNITMTTDATSGISTYHLNRGFTESDGLQDNMKIYYAVYKSGLYESGGELTNTVDVSNTTYEPYSFKAYVFGSVGKAGVNSTMIFIDAPTPPFKVYATYTVEEDVETDGSLYGGIIGRVSRIIVQNTANISGEWRKLSYGITSSTDEEGPTAWYPCGDNGRPVNKYTIYKSTQGKEKYWIKLEPYNEYASGSTAVTQLLDLDLELKEDPEIIVNYVSTDKATYVTVNNTKDNAGNWRQLYYLWTDTNDRPADSAIVNKIDGGQWKYTMTDEGVKYLWTKMAPSIQENLDKTKPRVESTKVELAIPVIPKSYLILTQDAESTDFEGKLTKAVYINALPDAGGVQHYVRYIWKDTKTEPTETEWNENAKQILPDISTGFTDKTTMKNVDGTKYLYARVYANSPARSAYEEYKDYAQKSITVTQDLSLPYTVEPYGADDFAESGEIWVACEADDTARYFEYCVNNGDWKKSSSKISNGESKSTGYAVDVGETVTIGARLIPNTGEKYIKPGPVKYLTITRDAMSYNNIPSLNCSDSVQTTEGAREVYITPSSYGKKNGCRISYKLDNASWTSEVYTKSKITVKTTKEGSHTIKVREYPALDDDNYISSSYQEVEASFELEKLDPPNLRMSFIQWPGSNVFKLTYSASASVKSGDTIATVHVNCKWDGSTSALTDIITTVTNHYANSYLIVAEYSAGIGMTVLLNINSGLYSKATMTATQSMAGYITSDSTSLDGSGFKSINDTLTN